MQFISSKEEKRRIKRQEHFLLQIRGIPVILHPKLPTKYNQKVLPNSSSYLIKIILLLPLIKMILANIY